MPSLAGNKQLFHPSLTSEDTLFHLPTENGQPNPSEIDIEVFIPTSTFLFTVLNKIFPKWEKEKIFP